MTNEKMATGCVGVYKEPIEDCPQVGNAVFPSWGRIVATQEMMLHAG